jgi:7-carboxy-7-deazaguanine synthase
MGEPGSRHNLQIVEIFKSIQGEGASQGEPTTFIRTGGCNLRCDWCDTAYAQTGGKPTAVGRIVDQVDRLNCSNVCLTGGEPLLQKHLGELIDALKRAGFFVSVETNGTLDIGAYPQVDRFAVDYKLGSARATVPFLTANLGLLRDTDELKLVVADRPDYEEARAVLAAHRTKGTVIMSPCWGRATAEKLAAWIVEDNLPVRYSVQLHKLIGVR